MTDVLFVSGWAGVATFCPGRAARADFTVPFIDGDEAALVARAAASPARVLAGWSTGAHMLLKHGAALFPRFTRVVLFAPFARFTDSFPERTVRTMRAAMDADAAATVRAFWQNCGLPQAPAFDPAWAAPLAAGLDSLLLSAVSGEPVPAGNVTVVWGEGDRIVRRKALDRVLPLLPGAALRLQAGGHWPSPDILAEHCF
ncbi:alpha/beta fold hydrolase [Solidesulfovibrio sp.]|uniref:alpha/beta fold hydrolase n=1 Tax=Solidesulfovibrio sp. TaxID=2910990 RepID=UPI002B1F39FA|nr:alpha/beta fold hydrolase [Solidesulfovibrio sp.]MEA4857583.1 alpha/beta hydrolase [Solidesulfovibrio sp.]